MKREIHFAYGYGKNNNYACGKVKGLKWLPPC